MLLADKCCNRSHCGIPALLASPAVAVQARAVDSEALCSSAKTSKAESQDCICGTRGGIPPLIALLQSPSVDDIVQEAAAADALRVPGVDIVK